MGMKRRSGGLDVRPRKRPRITGRLKSARTNRFLTFSWRALKAVRKKNTAPIPAWDAVKDSPILSWSRWDLDHSVAGHHYFRRSVRLHPDTPRERVIEELTRFGKDWPEVDGRQVHADGCTVYDVNDEYLLELKVPIPPPPNPRPHLLAALRGHQETIHEALRFHDGSDRIVLDYERSAIREAEECGSWITYEVEIPWALDAERDVLFCHFEVMHGDDGATVVDSELHPFDGQQRDLREKGSLQPETRSCLGTSDSPPPGHR